MDSGLRQLTPRDYPDALREIPEPPEALFMRGTLAPAGTAYLAVVGSRALSPYGRDAARHLIMGLTGHPISIVSGLALGADAVAHEAAFEAGLHTIAVLASGVGDASISPRTNFPLASRILASGGALLSENGERYTPYPSDFPKRNRIVVGLAQAVLVIEAGERSGTLITARLASEYNRELLCVPHRITDPNSFGANLFVRLGATLVSTPEHILEALNLFEEQSPNDLYLSENEKVLLPVLEKPERIELLLLRSPLNESDTRACLILLEMKGYAKQEYGVWKKTS